jgi:hypothetical protein
VIPKPRHPTSLIRSTSTHPAYPSGVYTGPTHWHVNAVHTPAVVPEAPSIRKSINCPAVIGTDPVATQLALVPSEHTSAVSDSDVGELPARSVTFSVVDDDCEYTVNCVAVQLDGTHASTLALSVVPTLPFGEFTA